MPPLPGHATVLRPSLVPVVHLSRVDSPGKTSKGKAPARYPPRRQYSDEPLCTKPDANAPKNARIIRREQEHAGALVKYQLKIGEVEINDVGVDEILDYVSALELEQFEMVRFREEARILRVLEQDREDERRGKLSRAAERARAKGAVFVDECSDSDESAEVQLGRHGRARPDYSKFYKKPRGKGKEIFEDLVDEEMADESIQTNDDETLASQQREAVRPTGALQDLPKQRRRRRNPATGELMDLRPAPQLVEKQKRKRRRRHPLTGELMPYGWKYDPEAESNAFETRRMDLGSAMKETALKRLSISEQHDAKRPRLDTESANSSSVSPVPTKAEIMGQASSQHRGSPKGSSLKPSVVDLMSSDDEPEVVFATLGSSMKPRPQQAGNSMMKGTITSAATTSADESSPDPPAVTSITSPSASQRTPRAPQPTTSILSPSAARASSMDPLAAGSEQETSEDEAEDDEWLIESILGHRMSDPKTHPHELGQQSVMLYSVKWVGYDDPTWEPMESFGDRSVVDGYRKKVGLRPLPGANEKEVPSVTAQRKPATTTHAAMSTSNAIGAAESEDDDAEYEIETIMGHQLSDPRTHPAELGKTPVMLYQVKWKGFDELTWEPEASFGGDLNFLRAYRKKHGLR